jgi:hypothetical protein
MKDSIKKNFYCGDEVDYDDKCLEQCDNCNNATGVDYGYIEDAAVINYKKLYEGEPLTQDVPIDAFIKGSKWQMERSYSEKEVMTILYCFHYDLVNSNIDTKEEWFEQFKKIR